MKKFFLCLFLISFTTFVFAQSDDELFGGDDDFFFDDGIEEITEVQAKTDLSKGVLFENGSIKIGGNFTTSLGTSTILYNESDKNNNRNFGDNLKDTTLTPTASAYLSVDARPSQTLRMYTKFGLAYPFKLNAISSATTTESGLLFFKNYKTLVSTSVTDWFTLKELFTDFSIADRAFFRFGLHTVTWGAGYFFSPVSDMINTSSINPEDVTAQVDGSLNLRTQITFPGTQNCLWTYIIPSTNFNSSYTNETYARDTALAGKFDLLLGSVELGFGGFYKYENSPKAMITATGSLKKLGLFGEMVYQYGSDSEWNDNTAWENKTNIFQATVGMSYFWKTPVITLAAQYYYDGNKKDMLHQYVTYGHNLAAAVNFGKVFGTKDVTISLFGMANYGKEEIPSLIQSYVSQMGISSYLNTATFSVMLNYTPVNEIKIGLGPYITFSDWDSTPITALKLSFSLGGGKF